MPGSSVGSDNHAVERMLLLNQTGQCLIHGDIPGLVMLRMDEEPQDVFFQKIFLKIDFEKEEGRGRG